MNLVLHSLVTASLMLTLACGLAAFLLRRLDVVTPRLRQGVLFCVMLQGLMLFRMPVELPWLESAIPDSGGLMDSASRSATRLEMASFDDSPAAITTGLFDSNETGNAPQSLTNWFALDRWFDLGVDPLVMSVVLIWLVGFLLVMLRGALRYRALCRTLDQLDRAPESWQSEWQHVCSRRDRAAPEMLVSQSLGPMLVRRPKGYSLVVPECFWRSLSVSQRRGVLLHELAHLFRHDVWRQLVARTAAGLHWCNPVAWWCVRRYEESAEWACDEWLTKNDPIAAKGLASSLVQLAEFMNDGALPNARVIRSVGVQSMAAPPLTERVTRLLNSSSPGDSVMKRCLLVILAAGLLTLSTVQFRLVQATAEDAVAEDSVDARPGLRVLSSDSKDQLHSLRDRLNPNDKASADLKSLLGTESGQVAFAGVIDLLEGKYREKARGEAIPRFVEKHFETTSEDKLALRDQSRAIAASWVSRSKQLGDVLDGMQKEMKSIADRLDDSGEVNQMARRMLTDDHVGFAIMLDEFDGRSDPIELFLSKAFEKVLVRRGDKMVVIPTLSGQQLQQIERFEIASEVASILRTELPEFAAEFAEPDENHEKFVVAMKDPAMAAVLAIHVVKDNSGSASRLVDALFEQLEKVSRDTADGLVIHDQEAWENVNELMESGQRAGDRVEAVRERMIRIADTIDSSDPLSARLIKQLKTGVIAYQVAAELPYADFDLGKQVTGMISQVLEPVGSNGLRVREDAASEVNNRAEELLTASRRIRRYLRQVDAVRERLVDRQLADSLDGPGRMLLLSEIRRHAEQSQLQSMELLAKEFFLVDETTKQLTVRPERVEVVGQLAKRARELDAELSNDDF